jgi:hypothetical protein
MECGVPGRVGGGSAIACVAGPHSQEALNCVLGSLLAECYRDHDCLIW